jgi:hypothetical protein
MERMQVLAKKVRSCFACGSKTSYIVKRGTLEYYQWYLNHDKDDNALCNKCDKKYYSNARKNPELVAMHNKRSLRFDGRTIHLKTDPRIGICNLCRAVRGFDTKITQMHHEYYDAKNPLAGTLEVCVECHQKLTTEQRREKIKSRVCYACGSKDTAKHAKTGKQIWALNKDKDDNALCRKCYRKYIEYPNTEKHKRALAKRYF